MLDLYKNIRIKRVLNGWTQSDLAKKAGYSDKSMIAKIENGKVDLSQSKIKMFADIFGCTPADLMGWTEESEVPEYVVGTHELIELYHKATPEQQKAVIAFLRSFVN